MLRERESFFRVHPVFAYLKGRRGFKGSGQSGIILPKAGYRWVSFMLPQHILNLPPSGAEHGQTLIFHAKVKTWKHKNQSHAKPPSPQRKHKTNNIKYLASLRLCVSIDLGIFSTYDYPISTGPLERANNKSKTMKWQAYGFRDRDFFKLKIMAIHYSRYALVG